MNLDPKNSIEENVLKAIEAGKVKMRPKWHFVLRAVLLITGTVLVSLTLLYLISFIIFILRQTGVLFVPGFGLRGINVFLMSTPWLLVLLAVLFIVFLQILIKKYSFGYGKPLMYSAIGIIVFVLIGGILVEKTSLHRGLFMQAENNGLPFAGRFYRQYGEQKLKNVTAGIITEITDNGYKIETRSGEIVTVVVTPQTQLPMDANFSIGDKIVVLGEHKDNTVIAEGIIEFDGQMPPHRGGGPPPGDSHIPR